MAIDTHRELSDDFSDDELERWTLDFIRTHLRTIIKAPIIGMMAGFSVLTVSGSLYKALIIVLAGTVLSGFATWRRFLEPISFWLFLGSVVYWCDVEIVGHLKTTARSLASISRS
ncbi:MAG: hypothetical protein JWR89_2057 [Tardiphaga sp.]|uniref:hypothetical protein n=1 Tax=Tardiphaga sp. TaxID=1926292 RepID=UPI00260C3132|nr:hypothetical protein [Tardiphaga sp.]MDB5502155.1 hypothetical protein [Tardiphaga sp.]